MQRHPIRAARLGALVLSLTLLVPLATAPAASAAPLTGAPSPSAPVPAGPVLPESYPWVRLAEAARPAVVNVRVRGETARAGDGSAEEAIPERFRRFLPPELRERLPEGPRGQRRGLGSGFIVEPDGYIVTNHHVVDGAKTIDVTLADGRTLPGKVVGNDPETDLALLKVEAKGLPTITLGRSATLKVGEPVMAIGNPFGLDHTVTVGIISGTSRVIGAGRYDDFLQTDAAINPGNSGGPLVNTQGEAIGIATAIASRGGGFQGVGFAIPSDLARPILEQLRTAGRVSRGWLGVSIQTLTPELARSFGLERPDGVLVASVVEGSPAAQAGLRAGDVIVRYDGKAVDTPRVLSASVASTPIGRGVEVGVMRDGSVHPLRVTIAALEPTRPASAPTSDAAERQLGLEVEPLSPSRARQAGVKAEQGLLVTGVRPNSPAAAAGITEGDVIREINRTPVASTDDVAKSLARSAEKSVLLRIERDGAARYLVVPLA